LVILIIPILLYLIFLSSTVQTYLSNKIADKLSQQTNTPIHVEGVDFSPLKNLILKGVYVEDYKQDTLAYIKKLSVSVDSINFGNKKIYFDKISLEETKFKLFVREDSSLNLFVFLDSISKKKKKLKDTIDKKSWFLSINNLKLTNSEFSYKTFYAKTQRFGMNYNDMYYYNINLDANKLTFDGDILNIEVEQLNCKEKCGLTVDNFSAHSWITNREWGLSNVKASSPNSKVSANKLTFGYIPGQGYWRNFTSKMKLYFDINTSRVSFKDISFFNEILEGFRETGYFSGKVYGTIYDLKGKDIDVLYGDNTHIRGIFYANGLPSLENTYMDADFKELTTTISDLEKIYLPNYSKEYFKLHENFNNLGLIQYKGKFNGFLTDFVFYGDFKTRLGEIKTDILLRPQQGKSKLRFKGDLKTNNFNLGGLINQSKVGNISLNLAVEGQTGNKKLKAKMKGLVKEINFYNYTYKNLKLDGAFTESTFDGEISLEDPNIGFNFMGNVDLSDSIPIVNFQSELKKANLNALNLNTKDSISELSLSLNANFSGSSVDNANGVINFENTEYRNKRGSFNIDEIKIKSKVEKSSKELSVNSDFAKLNVHGNYLLPQLISSFKNIVYFYLPAYAPIGTEVKIDSVNKFNFELNLLKTTDYTKILYPQIEIDSNSKIIGSIDSRNRVIDLDVFSPKVIFNGRFLDELHLQVKSDSSNLTVKGRMNKLSFNNNYHIYNLSNKITAGKDKIKLDILWNNWGEKTYSGYLSAQSKVSRNLNNDNLKWDIDILPSTIIMADSIQKHRRQH